METTDLKPAEFSCHAPDAQAVNVAGTFNDWKPVTLPLDRQADGYWKTTLPLPPGHHEFKFIVDGQWCCEPGAKDESQERSGYSQNPFGTMNRVLELS